MARKDELFQKLNHGDRAALDGLIRAYYPEVFRYCLCHTANRQNAEDATQETFLKLVRHVDGIRNYKCFRAYLYKIAANTCADLWRQDGQPEPLEPETYLETGFAQTESELNFQGLLRLLPAEQREVLVLRYVQELKFREIADVLGEPLRTVQSRHRAALKTLEKHLTKGEPEWTSV